VKGHRSRAEGGCCYVRIDVFRVRNHRLKYGEEWNIEEVVRELRHISGTESILDR